MAEDRLYHSVIAEQVCRAGRYVVFGNTLKPFCLLHSLQLSQLGNPLWCEGTPEPEDLIAAAQICASHDPVIEFVAQKSDDPVSDLNAWIAYMETCAASPMTKDRIQDAFSSEYHTPAEASAVVYLMRVLGITEERAWRMPYGLAWWYIQTASEQQLGESYILTQDEKEFQDSMNTPEAIEERRVRDENVQWIVANIKDPAKRQELLNAASTGELTGNWRTEHGG